MKVKSIAECSLGAFCNTFDLHLVIIGLEYQYVVFLRVAFLHRFYCTLILYVCEKLRLWRDCIGSSDPSMLANVISTVKPRLFEVPGTAGILLNNR